MPQLPKLSSKYEEMMRKTINNKIPVESISR